MATGNFYRGTSQTQDARFSNKDKKLLNSREWPTEFDLKVNMKKVEINAIKPWIQRKITEILGFEDEVVINLAISELETKEERGPCPKRIQLNLTGFLTNKASYFMKELWNLLLEAQDSPLGIPPSLILEKKEEIQQKNDELISQEAKLENIKAFLKQAEQDIKNKIGQKKPINDNDNNYNIKDHNNEKNKDFTDKYEKKNFRKEEKKYRKKYSSSKSKSRSRSKSNKREKIRYPRKEERKKNNFSNEAPKQTEQEKKKSENLKKDDKNKKKQKKLNLSSPSKSDSGSSDESSPISDASD